MISGRKWIWISIIAAIVVSVLNIAIGVKGERSFWSLIVTLAELVLWVFFVISAHKEKPAMIWGMVFWGISGLTAVMNIIALGGSLDESFAVKVLTVLFSSHLYGIRFPFASADPAVWIMFFVSLVYVVVSLGFLLKIRRGDYTE